MNSLYPRDPHSKCFICLTKFIASGTSLRANLAPDFAKQIRNEGYRYRQRSARHFTASRGTGEVRLPQELRFTDDRRSTIGDIPLARHCARPPKSSRRNGFHTSSHLLCSLRIPLAAFLFHSNLRSLLDGDSCPGLSMVLCADRCGDALDAPPVIDGIASTQLCRACRLAPPPFVRAVAFTTYEGRMREAIHALKYGRIHPAARRLGAMLGAAIAQMAPDAPRELLVVPVPLHRSKHRERGFNQARALAVYAIRALRKSHPELHLTLAPSTLMRQRSTESQAGLTPRQRRLNVRGDFKVSDPTAVRDRHILLVDDILTTGATARAAAQSLIKAGAASVYVATLARARRINFTSALAAGRVQPGVGPAVAGMHSSSSTHQPST